MNRSRSPWSSREPAGDPLGVGLVVPQVGRGDLLAEVGDLGAHRVEVQHLLDGVHRRLELLDLGLEVGSCHVTQPTRRYRRRRIGRRRGRVSTQVPHRARGAVMPQQAWSKKRERQYEHVKEASRTGSRRGHRRGDRRAHRQQGARPLRRGPAEEPRRSTDDISSGRRGGLRSHSGAGGRTKDAALQRGEAEGHQGPLEDDQGRAREGRRPLSDSSGSPVDRGRRVRGTSGSRATSTSCCRSSASPRPACRSSPASC